ncbi:dipeptide/oligopeptide/nickel ABC transporter permease/ATP-binding protein [Longispora sp. NPDC051575]|uniref:dipeptide/oligopeptide/nickel ABC transporter permease/ATP-binding protein n=1 Tax=Longispora sp. NPDC051575 TaxID=3154943 RepID=UPI0034297AEF
MTRGMWTGVGIAVAVVALAVAGPGLLGVDPDLPDYARQLTPPGADHWLGTDQSGRDQLARTLAGLGKSLQAVLVVFALTTAIGITVGGLAGYLGGVVDAVVGRVIDALLGLPSQIVALAVVGALGVGSTHLILAIVASGWAYPARIARGAVLGSDRRLDVTAARLAGIGRIRILFGHVLPGATTTVLVAATTTVGETTLTLAGLSFLGLGAQPPTAELGQLLADSQGSLVSSPWLLIGPTVLIAAMVASAMLISDALRDAVDPRPRPARPRRNPKVTTTQDISGVLSATDLVVTYPDGTRAVRGVSLTVAAGECVAVVGESGCGKTTLARSVLGLLPAGATLAGTLAVDGTDVAGLDRRGLRRLRGRVVGYVAQDPYAACDPLRSVGHHVGEAWRHHGRRPPRGEVVRRVDALGIADAADRLTERPYRWSGGMLQRATIAAAGAHQPVLTIADEPTSALDAHLADDILGTLRASCRSLLLISHDLRLVARHADRIVIMYAGRIVETGPTAELLGNPRHPYTRALLAATPRPGGDPVTALPGTPPALRGEPGPGCAFADRCARVTDGCRDREPVLVGGVACWEES